MLYGVRSLKFLDQGADTYLLQWKCGVLTTGRPGKSPTGLVKNRDLAVLAWPSLLVCPSFLKNQSTMRKGFFLSLNLSHIKLVRRIPEVQW